MFHGVFSINSILTQRMSSSFLGSVSSGGSGLAFPFPFPFLARTLLRGALAGLFVFSWVEATLVELAMAPAGQQEKCFQFFEVIKKKQSIIFLLSFFVFDLGIMLFLVYWRIKTLFNLFDPLHPSRREHDCVCLCLHHNYLSLKKKIKETLLTHSFHPPLFKTVSSFVHYTPMSINSRYDKECSCCGTACIDWLIFTDHSLVSCARKRKCDCGQYPLGSRPELD